MQHIYSSKEFIEDIAISGDETMMAGTFENYVFIVDPKTGELIKEFTLEENIAEIESLYFDKLNRLVMDHRSHFSVWDGKNGFDPEFQELAGYCFCDSNYKGEWLVSYPEGNRVFYVDAALKSCREIMRYDGILDFMDIGIACLDHDLVLVHIPASGKFRSFSFADFSSTILPLNDEEGWFKGKVFGASQDSIVFWRENIFYSAKFLPDGSMEEKALGTIPFEPGKKVKVNPDLSILASEMGDSVSFYSLNTLVLIKTIPYRDFVGFDMSTNEVYFYSYNGIFKEKLRLNIILRC